MNENEAQAHRQTWDLLPWIVNGTATADDRRRVETHLSECSDCRDEFALQSQLHAGINVETAASRSAQPALQRLLARIDTSEGDAPDTQVHWEDPRTFVGGTRGSPRWVQALVAAVVVQAIGLSLLGALLLEHTPSASNRSGAGYETLSSAPSVSSSASIRLVPSATLTIAALQALLAESDLRIVETSGNNAIFGVAAASARPIDVPAVIARLRADPGVKLAEPIAAAAP